MKYKEGGRTEFKRGKALTEDIAEVAAIPGGLDLLVSMAAQEYGGDTSRGKQVRLFNMGGYADGGATMQAAERTRQAGRGDDEVLLHLAPEEFEVIESMWGPADVNPRTGIPEYGFLSKLWKGVKKVVKKIVKSPLFSFVAPIALNVFAPGLGSAVGGWLGATGKAAATIGNTIIRGGLGAISGGKEGAISGVLSGLTSGGVGEKIGKGLGLGEKTAKLAGDALLGGAAGEATGVGFAQGATGQALQSLAGNPMQKLEAAITDKGQEFFGTGKYGDIGGSSLVARDEDPFGLEGLGIPTQPSGPMSPIPPELQTPTLAETAMGGGGGGGATSFLGRTGDWMRDHPWLTAGGALLAGTALGGGRQEEGGGRPELPDSFTQSLPNLSFDRQAMPDQDYFNYGRASSANPGEAMFFEGNSIDGLPPAAPPGGPPGGAPPFVPPRGGRGIAGMVGDMYRQAQAGDYAQGPRKLKGLYWPVEAAKLQSEGWTIDQDNRMAYPPGSFGPTGAAMGGEVMAYKLGGLVQKYAEGGSAHHVKGPGTGRSDDIPAVLSDGEYVIDSESVALLGDGSTDAGAKRLDEMRENLRKHKGKELSKGKFSAAAKKPEEYMAKGGSVSKSGIRDLKRLANRLEQAIESGNKKRVSEISAQLKSLDGGNDVLKGMAKGGSVKRIIDSLERSVESDYRGPVEGKVERRLRDRRQRERKEDPRKKRRLSDKERAELAEELGGFPQNSRFIRNLRKELAKEAD